MAHYELIKIIINIPSVVEVILDIVMQYHSLPNSIMSDWGSVFTLKIWLSLYYFLKIKQKLSTVFYPQIDSQTEM